MENVRKEIKYNGNTYVLENEDNYVIEKHDNVNSPNHYKQGKKETIDVIQDCMTNDEYHGYLKGNVLKYVSRYKFKGEPLEDLKKANWYLNRLIKEVE
jgi:aconitase A